MQLAFAPAESIASDQEDSGFQNERKEPFDRFGLGYFGHVIRLIFWRVPVLFPLPVFVSIDNDKNKDDKTQH